MADIPKILAELRPGEEWSINGDRTLYSNLIWLDTTTKPTEQEIDDYYEANKVATYAEEKIKELSPLIGKKIVYKFEHTIDSVDYTFTLDRDTQTNYDALVFKSERDEIVTQKIHGRKKSDDSRQFLTLDKAKIKALYDAAFTHKKDILDRFNTFKENAIGAATLADIDIEVTSIKTDLNL